MDRFPRRSGHTIDLSGSRAKDSRNSLLDTSKKVRAQRELEKRQQQSVVIIQAHIRRALAIRQSKIRFRKEFDEEVRQFLSTKPDIQLHLKHPQQIELPRITFTKLLRKFLFFFDPLLQQSDLTRLQLVLKLAHASIQFIRQLKVAEDGSIHVQSYGGLLLAELCTSPAKSSSAFRLIFHFYRICLVLLSHSHTHAAAVYKSMIHLYHHDLLPQAENVHVYALPYLLINRRMFINTNLNDKSRVNTSTSKDGHTKPSCHVANMDMNNIATVVGIQDLSLFLDFSAWSTLVAAIHSSASRNHLQYHISQFCQMVLVELNLPLSHARDLPAFVCRHPTSQPTVSSSVQQYITYCCELNLFTSRNVLDSILSSSYHLLLRFLPHLLQPILSLSSCLPHTSASFPHATSIDNPFHALSTLLAVHSPHHSLSGGGLDAQSFRSRDTPALSDHSGLSASKPPVGMGQVSSNRRFTNPHYLYTPYFQSISHNYCWYDVLNLIFQLHTNVSRFPVQTQLTTESQGLPSAREAITSSHEVLVQNVLTSGASSPSSSLVPAMIEQSPLLDVITPPYYDKQSTSKSRQILSSAMSIINLLFVAIPQSINLLCSPLFLSKELLHPTPSTHIVDDVSGETTVIPHLYQGLMANLALTVLTIPNLRSRLAILQREDLLTQPFPNAADNIPSLSAYSTLETVLLDISTGKTSMQIASHGSALQQTLACHVRISAPPSQQLERGGKQPQIPSSSDTSGRSVPAATSALIPASSTPAVSVTPAMSILDVLIVGVFHRQSIPVYTGQLPPISAQQLYSGHQLDTAMVDDDTGPTALHVADTQQAWIELSSGIGFTKELSLCEYVVSSDYLLETYQRQSLQISVPILSLFEAMDIAKQPLKFLFYCSSIHKVTGGTSTHSLTSTLQPIGYPQTVGSAGGGGSRAFLDRAVLSRLAEGPSQFQKQFNTTPGASLSIGQPSGVASTGATSTKPPGQATSYGDPAYRHQYQQISTLWSGLCPDAFNQTSGALGNTKLAILSNIIDIYFSTSSQSSLSQPFLQLLSNYCSFHTVLSLYRLISSFISVKSLSSSAVTAQQPHPQRREMSSGVAPPADMSPSSPHSILASATDQLPSNHDLCPPNDADMLEIFNLIYSYNTLNAVSRRNIATKMLTHYHPPTPLGFDSNLPPPSAVQSHCIDFPHIGEPSQRYYATQLPLLPQLASRTNYHNYYLYPPSMKNGEKNHRINRIDETCPYCINYRLLNMHIEDDHDASAVINNGSRRTDIIEVTLPDSYLSRYTLASTPSISTFDTIRSLLELSVTFQYLTRLEHPSQYSSAPLASLSPFIPPNKSTTTISFAFSKTAMLSPVMILRTHPRAFISDRGRRLTPVLERLQDILMASIPLVYLLPLALLASPALFTSVYRGVTDDLLSPRLVFPGFDTQSNTLIEDHRHVINSAVFPDVNNLCQFFSYFLMQIASMPRQTTTVPRVIFSHILMTNHDVLYDFFTFTPFSSPHDISDNVLSLSQIQGSLKKPSAMPIEYIPLYHQIQRNILHTATHTPVLTHLGHSLFGRALPGSLQTTLQEAIDEMVYFTYVLATDDLSTAIPMTSRTAERFLHGFSSGSRLDSFQRRHALRIRLAPIQYGYLAMYFMFLLALYRSVDDTTLFASGLASVADDTTSDDGASASQDSGSGSDMTSPHDELTESSTASSDQSANPHHGSPGTTIPFYLTRPHLFMLLLLLKHCMYWMNAGRSQLSVDFTQFYISQQRLKQRQHDASTSDETTASTTASDFDADDLLSDAQGSSYPAPAHPDGLLASQQGEHLLSVLKVTSEVLFAHLHTRLTRYHFRSNNIGQSEDVIDNYIMYTLMDQLASHVPLDSAMTNTSIRPEQSTTVDKKEAHTRLTLHTQSRRVPRNRLYTINDNGQTVPPNHPTDMPDDEVSQPVLDITSTLLFWTRIRHQLLYILDQDKLQAAYHLYMTQYQSQQCDSIGASLSQPPYHYTHPLHNTQQLTDHMDSSPSTHTSIYHLDDFMHTPLPPSDGDEEHPSREKRTIDIPSQVEPIIHDGDQLLFALYSIQRKQKDAAVVLLQRAEALFTAHLPHMKQQQNHFWAPSLSDARPTDASQLADLGPFSCPEIIPIAASSWLLLIFQEISSVPPTASHSTNGGTAPLYSPPQYQNSSRLRVPPTFSAQFLGALRSFFDKILDISFDEVLQQSIAIQRLDGLAQVIQQMLAQSKHGVDSSIQPGTIRISQDLCGMLLRIVDDIYHLINESTLTFKYIRIAFLNHLCVHDYQIYAKSVTFHPPSQSNDRADILRTAYMSSGRSVHPFSRSEFIRDVYQPQYSRHHYRYFLHTSLWILPIIYNQGWISTCAMPILNNVREHINRLAESYNYDGFIEDLRSLSWDTRCAAGQIKFYYRDYHDSQQIYSRRNEEQDRVLPASIYGTLQFVQKALYPSPDRWAFTNSPPLSTKTMSMNAGYSYGIHTPEENIRAPSNEKDTSFYWLLYAVQLLLFPFTMPQSMRKAAFFSLLDREIQLIEQPASFRNYDRGYFISIHREDVLLSVLTSMASGGGYLKNKIHVRYVNQGIISPAIDGGGIFRGVISMTNSVLTTTANTFPNQYLSHTASDMGFHDQIRNSQAMLLSQHQYGALPITPVKLSLSNQYLSNDNRRLPMPTNASTLTHRAQADTLLFLLSSFPLGSEHNYVFTEALEALLMVHSRGVSDPYLERRQDHQTTLANDNMSRMYPLMQLHAIDSFEYSHLLLMYGFGLYLARCLQNKEYTLQLHPLILSMLLGQQSDFDTLYFLNTSAHSGIQKIESMLQKSLMGQCVDAINAVNSDGAASFDSPFSSFQSSANSKQQPTASELFENLCLVFSASEGFTYGSVAIGQYLTDLISYLNENNMPLTSLTEDYGVIEEHAAMDEGDDYDSASDSGSDNYSLVDGEFDNDDENEDDDDESQSGYGRMSQRKRFVSYGQYSSRLNSEHKRQRSQSGNKIDQSARTAQLDDAVSGTSFTLALPETENDEQECLLVPLGNDLPVNDMNFYAYKARLTRLYTHHLLSMSLTALKLGFHTLISPSLVGILSMNELHNIMYQGSVAVDINEWKRYTSYSSRTIETHRITQWFWEIVEEMTPNEQLLLLKFITGSPSLNHGGFRSLDPLFAIQINPTLYEPVLYGAPVHPTGPDDRQINIMCYGTNSDDTGVQKRVGNREHPGQCKCDYVMPFPKSAVCFNMIKIPIYHHKATMREKLKMAIFDNSYELT